MKGWALMNKTQNLGIIGHISNISQKKNNSIYYKINPKIKARNSLRPNSIKRNKVKRGVMKVE